MIQALFPVLINTYSYGPVLSLTAVQTIIVTMDRSFRLDRDAAQYGPGWLWGTSRRFQQSELDDWSRKGPR